MNIIQKTAKINSIFLAIVLIAGTFAAVYPSFIIGIQAQSEYEYENENENENGYRYNDNHDNSYNSAEYSSRSYEYPQQVYDEYEDNSNDDDNYYYPPTEEKPISADIVVPNDFETIQEAIDAADEGDVIKVLPGTYTEQLNITKSLTIVGSGAKSTIIESPPLEELKPSIVGPPYIINIDNEAQVILKGFTINGIEGTNCDALFGITVLGDATLKLDSTVIKDCTNVGILAGSLRIPTGPQTGHATITNTVITDYRASGITVPGSGSTLTISQSKIIGNAPDAFGIIGISFHTGAKAKIVNNIISDNICKLSDPNDDLPECGSHPINEIQAFGIAAANAGNGSIISNNYVSNNDAGIGIFGESGCCIINHNKLTDNEVFGIVIQDSEHTVSNTKIFGGNIGVLAIATTANTTATLDQVKIIGTEIPIQAFSTGNLTAAVNVLSPSFFEP